MASAQKWDVDCGHIRALNILKLSEYIISILKYIISKYQRLKRSVDEERGLARISAFPVGLMRNDGFVPSNQIDGYTSNIEGFIFE